MPSNLYRAFRYYTVDGGVIPVCDHSETLVDPSLFHYIHPSLYKFGFDTPIAEKDLRYDRPEDFRGETGHYNLVLVSREVEDDTKKRCRYLFYYGVDLYYFTDHQAKEVLQNMRMHIQLGERVLFAVKRGGKYYFIKVVCREKGLCIYATKGTKTTELTAFAKTHRFYLLRREPSNFEILMAHDM